MEPTPQNFAVVFAALSWAANQIFQIYSDSRKKLTVELQDTREAVIELRVQMKLIGESMDTLRKLKSDVDVAHERIRELQAKSR